MSNRRLRISRKNVQIWRHIMRWFRAFKIFLETSSIHGLKYTVKKNYHWTERFIWNILCIASWCTCITTIYSIYRNFVEKPVAITVDTNYLDWTTSFPTIAICSSFNLAAKQYATALFKNYSNGRGNARQWAEQLSLPSRMGYIQRVERFNIPAEEYIAMYEKAKPNCLETFSYCEWNELRFNCCNEFVTMHTGIGYCLMLNSKHARPTDPSVDLSVNRTQKNAFLNFDLTDKYIKTNSDIQIFILNNVEIPTISTSNSKILKNIEKISGVDFYVQDISNEEGVTNVPADKRECRFPEENKDTILYDLYSFDGCTTDVDAMRMLQACGCISYTYPRKPGLQVCNMTGMRCISEFRRNTATGEGSGCAPDCEAASIDWYSYNWIADERTSRSGLRLKMLSRPHLRYQRYVVRSFFDVMVLGGGSIGLFTGASVLSIVEFLLWLFIRSYRSK